MACWVRAEISFVFNFANAPAVSLAYCFMATTQIYTLDFGEIGLKDVARVGGKNASLGQLFNALKPMGVGAFDGFAITADAYHRLLIERDLEFQLRSLLSDFDPEDVGELATRGHAARAAVLETPLPDDLRSRLKRANA
jgi:pyruvate, water dikinase